MTERKNERHSLILSLHHSMIQFLVFNCTIHCFLNENPFYSVLRKKQKNDSIPRVTVVDFLLNIDNDRNLPHVVVVIFLFLHRFSTTPPLYSSTGLQVSSYINPTYNSSIVSEYHDSAITIIATPTAFTTTTKVVAGKTSLEG